MVPPFKPFPMTSPTVNPELFFDIAFCLQRPYGQLGTGKNGQGLIQCCFTFTETTRLIRDGEDQEGHLDFYTAPELMVMMN